MNEAFTDPAAAGSLTRFLRRRHPTYNESNKWVTKNHYEHKTGERVLLEANIFENVWGGFTQPGKAIVLTPKKQTNEKDPGEGGIVRDVTARYLWIKKAGGVFQMANGPKPNHGREEHHYSFHDIVAEELTYPECHGCGADWMEISGGNNATSCTTGDCNLHDVEINHLTVLQHPQSNKSSQDLMVTGRPRIKHRTFTSAALARFAPLS